MHAMELLHKLYEKSAIGVHKDRITTIFVAVESLLYGKALTLTGLGRSVQNEAQVKNNIKRIDRLLGNKLLQEEVGKFYRVLAKYILRDIKQPIILIDWSQLGDNDKHYLISAAVPYGGRSFSIYQEVHPKSLYNTKPTNLNFLIHLQKILPTHCIPIIVTDAGTAFRSPWFKQIEMLHWDYVGRVRGGLKFCIGCGNSWNTCKELYVLAKTKAASLGKCILTKRTKFTCELILAKRTLKGRAGKGRNHKSIHESYDRKASRRARDPWLLATSLDFPPDIIISIYKQRMQIEELFRDTKNQRLGFGLKKSLSTQPARLNILLLIGTIANYVAFLVGQAAKALSMQYQFQSNTIKTRAVISVFNLGCQIILRRRSNIPISNIKKIFVRLNTFIIHIGNLT
jgi:hypothetical protein